MSEKAAGGDDGGKEEPDWRLCNGREVGVVSCAGACDGDLCCFVRLGVFVADEDCRQVILV